MGRIRVIFIDVRLVPSGTLQKKVRYHQTREKKYADWDPELNCVFSPT